MLFITASPAAHSVATALPASTRQPAETSERGVQLPASEEAEVSPFQQPSERSPAAQPRTGEVPCHPSASCHDASTEVDKQAEGNDNTRQSSSRYGDAAVV